jgi:hypothetical protein
LNAGGVDDAAYVNALTRAQARRRNIRVTVLSPFIAEFSGARAHMVWLRKNYRFLVCGFDVDQVINDKGVYMVCTSSAEKWIQAVQSDTPESLMAADTSFEATCAR